VEVELLNIAAYFRTGYNDVDRVNRPLPNSMMATYTLARRYL